MTLAKTKASVWLSTHVSELMNVPGKILGTIVVASMFPFRASSLPPEDPRIAVTDAGLARHLLLTCLCRWGRRHRMRVH